MNALKEDLKTEIDNYFKNTGRENSYDLDYNGAYDIRSLFKRISRGMQRKMNGTNMDPSVAEGIIAKLDILIDSYDQNKQRQRKPGNYSAGTGGRRRTRRLKRKTSRRRRQSRRRA